jgi:hypothetical protein
MYIIKLNNYTIDEKGGKKIPTKNTCLTQVFPKIYKE